MAKTRMINTRFWNDGYVAELEPIAKLLFLYLLTNQYTEMCGAYELSIRTMSFETGIPEEEVRNILSRFGMDEKVDYKDGWVIVKNFLKHQQKNPNIAKGIKRAVEELPESIKALIAFETDSHLNLNLNLNLSEDADAQIPVFERKIREKDEEYRALVKDLAAKDYLTAVKINQIALDEFLPYWLERGENGKKSRWEKEKVFDYQRRFRTWIKNFHRSDYLCVEGYWHRKGETCHHRPPEPDYKSLPVSEFAKSLNKSI